MITERVVLFQYQTPEFTPCSPKGQSEAANRRRDNGKDKEKGQKKKQSSTKTLHRILKIEQREHH
jgi:hypothetical protein